MMSDYAVFIGRNNSGKTNLFDAIRVVFENIPRFRNGTTFEVQIPTYIRADTLWFFENSSKPAVIETTVKLEGDEVGSIRDYFGTLSGIKVKVHEEKVSGKNAIKVKLDEISLLGYVTSASAKVDELLKNLKGNTTESVSEMKVVENGNIKNEPLFLEILSALEGKVHYINFYEGAINTGYEVTGLFPRFSLPKHFLDVLKRIHENSVTHMRFCHYLSRHGFGESYYHPETLEKPYNGMYLRCEQYGSGEKVIISLLATVLDKGGGNVFLLDEPEAHLHPAFIKRLGRLLEDLVRNENVQILLMTHSPLFVRNLSEPNKSLYFVKKRSLRTDLGAEYPSTRVIEPTEVLKDFPPATVKREIFFSDLIFLVEGITDHIILDNLMTVLNLQPLSNLYLGYIHYASRTPDKIFELIREVSDFMDVPSFMIADGDQQGREYIEKAKEKGFEEDDVFSLEDEDIFFVVSEEVLNKAIKNLITSKLEGYMREIIEIPEEIPFIKSKAELDGFISKLVVEPSMQQKLRVKLAREVVEVVKEVKDKKEAVKPYLKNILITINDRIKEVILD